MAINIEKNHIGIKEIDNYIKFGKKKKKNNKADIIQELVNYISLHALILTKHGYSSF